MFLQTFATVLELDLLELLVMFLSAVHLAFMELALLPILVIVEQLDTLELFAKFPSAVQHVFMEELAFYLKLAIALELDGTTPDAKTPSALTHASMDTALDLIHATAITLDTQTLIVKLLSAFLDALTLELAFFLTYATAALLLDGLDLHAALQYAIFLAKMVETVLVQMFATVPELDMLELNAKQM